jgi:hypothetical protein
LIIKAGRFVDDLARRSETRSGREMVLKLPPAMMLKLLPAVLALAR